jgi:CheY-like chemotaxis protein
MNGVIGMTSLLLETDLDAEQRRYAHTAASSAAALVTVLNDILDFSKVEAGQLQLESTNLDVRVVAEEVAQLLAATADAKDVDLLCHLDPGLPAAVLGDPARLRQVLTNLVGNAVKFTDSGEVVLSVDVLGVHAEHVDIRFVVRDTGIGIAPDAQARLFDPFSQADLSTTRRFGGTGLGLAISQRIVQAAGGQIEVDSAIGAGATFSFTLTFPCVPEAVSEPPWRGGQLAGVRVLVVDDHPTRRHGLTHMLQRWTLRTAEAAGTAEALRLLRDAATTDRFRLALVEAHLPDGDAADLLRAIRAEPAVAATRVVLLTTATPANIGAARLTGVDGHITKPVRQSELYDLLATLLANRGPDHQPDHLPATSATDPADTATRTPAAAPEASQTRHAHPSRLLVAEDNAVNQQVVRAILERLGYIVDIVDDGAAAVEAVGTGRYDLVLMDCHMPTMDGFEAATTIRRNEPDGTRLPIVALTASAYERDQQRCLDAGMDAHLAKPIDTDVLAETLQRLIAHEHGQHEVAVQQ